MLLIGGAAVLLVSFFLGYRLLAAANADADAASMLAAAEDARKTIEENAPSRTVSLIESKFGVTDSEDAGYRDACEEFLEIVLSWQDESEYQAKRTVLARDWGFDPETGFMAEFLPASGPGGRNLSYEDADLYLTGSDDAGAVYEGWAEVSSSMTDGIEGESAVFVKLTVSKTALRVTEAEIYADYS